MFEEKIKEPVLSDDIKTILNRSTGDINNKNTDDIIRYKYKTMKLLTSNKDILNTLHYNSNHELNGDDYRDVCIFDYMRLPDVKTNVKNYICFDVDDRNTYDSRIEKFLTFRVICHKDDIATDWGVSRTDLLGLIIKNQFDWSNVFGLTMVKIYDKGLIGDDDYYYREISYKSTTPNNLMNRLR